MEGASLFSEKSTAQDTTETIETLNKNIAEFERYKRSRFAQEAKVKLAKAYIEKESWDDALRVLRPLWQNMTYRHEGWWDVAEEICWDLRKVASQTGDGGTLVSVEWELMHDAFLQRPEWNNDMMKSLEGISTVAFKPAVVIREEDVRSFLSASFAFENAEGKVGDICTSQLTVNSFASSKSTPIIMTEVKLVFEGSLKPVTLRHKADIVPVSKGNIQYHEVSFSEASASRESQSSSLVGEADLTFAPGICSVFEFSCPSREAGEARAISATFSMATELFDLDYTVSFNRALVSEFWWYGGFSRRRISRLDPPSMIILPKPPKMDLKFTNLKEQYYTDEVIRLDLEITNGEDEESLGKLLVQITGDQPPAFTLKLLEDGSEGVVSEDVDVTEADLALGNIESTAKKLAAFELSPVLAPSMFDVTLELSYSLTSDLETRISRRTSIRLMVLSPFEANYDFSPRVDPRPWPSLFSHTEGDGNDNDSLEQTMDLMAHGIPQKWCLTTRYASFATENLVVEELAAEIISTSGGIACSASRSLSEKDINVTIQPRNIEECEFDVLTQKLSLDDRRSAAIDLSLVITWRRADSDGSPNISKLPVPRLLVAGSEPRVLAGVSYSTTIPSLIHLTYTIENPSMHFLTFSVLMNPNDKFAFSGTKQSTIQLVPLTRRSIRFQLLPSVRGEWIRPQFVVKDRYFQKVLRIAPTEGMKVDKDGVLVWVPPDDD